MTILFDLDDTLCKTSKIWTKLSFQYFRHKNITRKRPRKQDTYKLEDSFTMTAMQKQEYFAHMSLVVPYATLSPTPKAAKVLHSLAQTHRIIFITAREPAQYTHTLLWLEKVLHYTAPIIFSTNFKEDIKANDITPASTLLIDNSVCRCQSARQCGLQAFLFSGNQVDNSLADSTSNLVTISSLTQIPKLVAGLAI